MRTSVELVHGALDANCQQAAHALGDAHDYLVGDLLLLVGECAEHVGDLVFAVRRAVYAESQSRKVLCVRGLYDGLDAVVSSGATCWTQANLSEWKRNLIVDDEQLSGRDPKARQEVADRLTAAVHEDARLRKHHSLPFDIALAYQR